MWNRVLLPKFVRLLKCDTHFPFGLICYHDFGSTCLAYLLYLNLSLFQLSAFNFQLQSNMSSYFGIYFAFVLSTVSVLFCSRFPRSMLGRFWFHYSTQSELGLYGRLQEYQDRIQGTCCPKFVFCQVWISKVAHIYKTCWDKILFKSLIDLIGDMYT